MRRRAAIAALGVAVGALALSVVVVLAAPGMMDASFGRDGRVTIDGGGTEQAFALALQKDGKVLVAGYSSVGYDAVVYRLNRNGSFDRSFDRDGRLAIDNGGTEEANALVVQRDGKIVVAGHSTRGYDTVVYRLKRNGSFDRSFSTDGRLRIGSGGFQEALALTAQPDGKILIAGRSDGDAFVYRLRPNGAFDRTFAHRGRLLIDNGGEECAYALALQRDGKIVVAGSSTLNGDAVVYRLNANGSFDRSFAGDGRLAIDRGGSESARALALQANGKILVAGQTSVADDAVVYRLNRDGSFDRSFAGDGRLAIDNGGDESARAIALQSDGKIVVGGRSSIADGAVLYRLSPHGSFDRSFARGQAILGIDSGGIESARALFLQPDGKTVVAGSNFGGNAVVYRLEGSPPDGVGN
jgi:uncharacterized delta-60 repeat protein